MTKMNAKLLSMQRFIVCYTHTITLDQKQYTPYLHKNLIFY